MRAKLCSALVWWHHQCTHCQQSFFLIRILTFTSTLSPLSGAPTWISTILCLHLVVGGVQGGGDDGNISLNCSYVDETWSKLCNANLMRVNSTIADSSNRSYRWRPILDLFWCRHTEISIRNKILINWCFSYKIVGSSIIWYLRVSLSIDKIINKL